jgi:putative transposase
LREWDYSRPGAYFITLCCNKGLHHLFGQVTNGRMVLNEFGNIAEKWIKAIPERYEHVTIESYVVMPNHVHLIVIVHDVRVPVGAIHELPLQKNDTNNESVRNQRRIMIVPKIVGFYRMNVAKQINQSRGVSERSVWQRNYYEHIIRDEKSLYQIRQYVRNNPAHWDIDEENPGNKSPRFVAMPDAQRQVVVA